PWPRCGAHSRFGMSTWRRPTATRSTPPSGLTRATRISVAAWDCGKGLFAALSRYLETAAAPLASPHAAAPFRAPRTGPSPRAFLGRWPRRGDGARAVGHSRRNREQEERCARLG